MNMKSEILNVVFDLDGTLSDLTHRLPFLSSTPKDWESFHKGCIDDAPKRNLIKMTQLFYLFHRVIILTGRNDIVQKETIAWLDKHNVARNELVMRKADDRRDDTEVKLDMARRLRLTPSNTLAIFDDRQRVVDMWRDNGFTCCQVAQWKE